MIVQKKKINHIYFFIAFIAIICISSAFSVDQKHSINNDTGEDSLPYYFKNPPREYSILPFWSLNNTLDSNKMNWQIDQMLDKGVYGAFMHAREGLDQSETPYFSDGWWTAIESAVKHAHQKDFLTCLYDEDKWPSGSAGGRTVQLNPERNIKKIIKYSDFQTLGPQNMQINFANNAMAVYAGKISDRGVYDFSTQIDITHLIGKEWKVPAGKWAIIVFTMIKDPRGQINYMDSSTVADFLHITHDEYYKRLGPYFGNTIPGVFFDEIYANSSERKSNIFWSDDFIDQFKKIKGYDIKPYLSVIILDDPKVSPAKRFDFFDVVRILYGNAWFKQYADWADKHRIWVTGHTTEELVNYIRQSDYFFTEGQLQRPCTDNEDFRYGFPRVIDFYDPKQISSIGHLYGKNRVAAEAMGSGGYGIPLEDYRYGFSMLGVYGVNAFVPHLFHYSMDRPENQADWAPSWFYQNPYWKYFKPLAAYAQRISFITAQGKHVCNVAIAYPLTQAWLGGYNAQVDDKYYREVQRELLDHHIDYDVIDPYSLSKAVADSSGLKIGEEHYKILILPSLKALQTSVMTNINSFVAKGGILIGLNELPSASEKGTAVDPFIVQSMMQLFGFEPREIAQEQYRNWDKDQNNKAIIQSNSTGGKGIFTRYLNELPKIIHSEIESDIKVEGADDEWLQYQHRKMGKREVFYFVNSRKAAGNFRIDFKNIGKPYRWDPETGAITEINNYRISNDHLQLQLAFKPWESFFVVLEPKEIIRKDILVKATDIEDAELIQNKDGYSISGWSSGQQHFAEILKGENIIKQKWERKDPFRDIAVEGNWDFQICSKALNDKWTVAVNKDTIEIPVMQFRSAMNKDWKQIKVEDQFSKQKACSRYLSDWDASWISFYDNSMHLSEPGGGTVYFKKEFTITDAVKESVLDITADDSYELFVNGRSVGKDADWKTVEHYSIKDFLKIGVNFIVVKTTNTKGLLLEGSCELKNGSVVSFKTDHSWNASKDQIIWLPALEYASPPLGSWGNIQRKDQTIQFPISISYQQVLPPGSEYIIKPDIKGQSEIFINGTQLHFDHSIADIRKLLLKDSNRIAIHVRVGNINEGLQKPVKIICGKTSMPLKSWTDMGLSWYSGKALYSHHISVDQKYFSSDTKMVLDLGQVNHFAEIWVNDQLVCYRSWSPFRADITRFLHPGENKITIVAANLMVNEASWNMMDANIDNKDARWWNFGSIEREKEKLISGMLGPVKIMLYQKENIAFVSKEIK